MKLTPELIGNVLLRSEETQLGQKEYQTSPVKLEIVTETHFYFSFPEIESNIHKSEVIETRNLAGYDDDKWVLYGGRK